MKSKEINREEKSSNIAVDVNSKPLDLFIIASGASPSKLALLFCPLFAAADELTA